MATEHRWAINSRHHAWGLMEGGSEILGSSCCACAVRVLRCKALSMQKRQIFNKKHCELCAQGKAVHGVCGPVGRGA